MLSCPQKITIRGTTGRICSSDRRQDQHLPQFRGLGYPVFPLRRVTDRCAPTPDNPAESLTTGERGGRFEQQELITFNLNVKPVKITQRNLSLLLGPAGVKSQPFLRHGFAGFVARRGDNQTGSRRGGRRGKTGKVPASLSPTVIRCCRCAVRGARLTTCKGGAQPKKNQTTILLSETAARGSSRLGRHARRNPITSHLVQIQSSM
jgi:hypothetical protein